MPLCAHKEARAAHPGSEPFNSQATSHYLPLVLIDAEELLDPLGSPILYEAQLETRSFMLNGLTVSISPLPQMANWRPVPSTLSYSTTSTPSGRFQRSEVMRSSASLTD